MGKQLPYAPPPLKETYPYLGRCIATDLARAGNMTGSNIIRAMVYEIETLSKRVAELEANQATLFLQGTANDGNQ